MLCEYMSVKEPVPLDCINVAPNPKQENVNVTTDTQTTDENESSFPINPTSDLSNDLENENAYMIDESGVMLQPGLKDELLSHHIGIESTCQKDLLTTNATKASKSTVPPNQKGSGSDCSNVEPDPKQENVNVTTDSQATDENESSFHVNPASDLSKFSNDLENENSYMIDESGVMLQLGLKDELLSHYIGIESTCQKDLLTTNATKASKSTVPPNKNGSASDCMNVETDPKQENVNVTTDTQTTDENESSLDVNPASDLSKFSNDLENENSYMLDESGVMPQPGLKDELLSQQFGIESTVPKDQLTINATKASKSTVPLNHMGSGSDTSQRILNISLTSNESIEWTLHMSTTSEEASQSDLEKSTVEGVQEANERLPMQNNDEMSSGLNTTKIDTNKIAKVVLHRINFVEPTSGCNRAGRAKRVFPSRSYVEPKRNTKLRRKL